MLVYIKNKIDQPFMPRSLVKVRHLLGEGKTKVTEHEPFTIRIVYGSNICCQNIISAGIKESIKRLTVRTTPMQNMHLISGFNTEVFSV